MKLSTYAIQVQMQTTVTIARQVDYTIYYHHYFNELKKEVKELENLRESVQYRVDAARRYGEEINVDIVKWLKDVDEMVEKAERFFYDANHASTGCSSSWFPNLRLKRQFGKTSMKMITEIVRLQWHGNFDQVSFRTLIPPQDVSSLATSGKGSKYSRVSTPESIMESLKDPNLNMIGVWGLAGVGKTTLVKQVAMKATQNNSFDVVILVTVTRTLDHKRIQEQVAASLGLNFEEESLSERAAFLYDRLMKEKSFLIILDDLWEKIELHEIGIPVPKQKRSFKIIITSRSQELLRDKMNTQYFLLTTLPEHEAWNLFKEKAGLEYTANPELLSLATKVAAECAGLPLAIVTIANALKGRNPVQWKIALQELRNSALTDNAGTQEAIIELKQDAIIKDQKDYIFREISRSLELLENDAESIFCLCGLIMGDNLAKSDLFKYSVGLGFFEDIDKMKDVRNRFDECISKLEDLQLLQENNSREFFSMNNVVRNVAISLTSKHQYHFIRRHREGEEWPDSDKLENCRTIILNDRDINEHPEGLKCQNLNFFQLLKADSSSKLPDNFFKGRRGLRVLKLHDSFFKEMLALKVLDLTAAEFISPLPSSISHLKMLTALFLDYCVLGHTADIGKLKDLKILSLSNSSIKELPHELGQLIQLQFLDLSYCFQLKVIPSNVFSSLKKLEELYMLGSFDDWDFNDPKKQRQNKASIVELTNLSCLTTLEVIIPDARMLPGSEDIKRLFKGLKRGKVLMGRQSEFSQFFEHETSAALRVWLSSTVNENVGRSLACVDYLGIGDLKGSAENVVPRLNETGFPELKYLYVGHSEIQYIADPSGNSNDIDLFPNLDSLVLHSVRNLEKLCSGPLMRQYFSRLKFINVKNCDKLKSLFPFYLVRDLPHLLEIDLQSCYSMEGIVSDDGNAAIGALQFPVLRYLYLEHLPGLTGFRCEEITGNNNHDTPISLFCDKVMSPNLEILDIKWTKNLKTIWQCSQLLSNSFGKLKKIDIRLCVDLISIFPYQIISTIPCLETLTVAHCESLQEIVMTQVSTQPFSKEAIIECPMRSEIARIQVDDVEEMVFSKLKHLELENLSSLRSFCSETKPFKFPWLERLIISKCPQMKMICSGVLETPVLESVMKDGKVRRNRTRLKFIKEDKRLEHPRIKAIKEFFPMQIIADSGELDEPESSYFESSYLDSFPISGELDEPESSDFESSYLQRKRERG